MGEQQKNSKQKQKEEKTKAINHMGIFRTHWFEGSLETVGKTLRGGKKQNIRSRETKRRVDKEKRERGDKEKETDEKKTRYRRFPFFR